MLCCYLLLLISDNHPCGHTIQIIERWAEICNDWVRYDPFAPNIPPYSELNSFFSHATCATSGNQRERGVAIGSITENDGFYRMQETFTHGSTRFCLGLTYLLVWLRLERLVTHQMYHCCHVILNEVGLISSRSRICLSI